MFRKILALVIVAIIVIASCEESQGQDIKEGRNCSINEKYSKCGAHTACQRVCLKKKAKDCPIGCVKGCICKKGYKRRSEGSVCILKSDCPKKYQDDEDDPLNQDYDDDNDSTTESQ